MPEAEAAKPRKRKRSLWRDILAEWRIYLMVLPALLLTLVFSYIPMPGIILAFKDFKPLSGILSSPWVGFANIVKIFQLPNIVRSIWNTLLISALYLLICFPAPIVLALLLNEVRAKVFKKTVQTLTYLPHFLSWISVIGIAVGFYSTYGPLNDLRVAFGGEGTQRLMFLSFQSFFVPNVIILSLWKEIGWGTIIYLAALSSVNPELYESAGMDGAGKFQQMRHITLPSIAPTIIMLLIFQLGGLFNSNFELIFGLQNPYIDFDVISTVIYKFGIQKGQYSMTIALGFVQGLVGFLLTYIVNRIARATAGISIW